jgi:transcriptional regulator with XRE-family HTH domain
MNIETHRAELAEFLRFHRSQLRPENLGLPAGPRRRTRGLRREEVAAAASISTAWYTWLEQGRPVRPSMPVLQRIANALRLTEQELAYIALLAGLSPDFAAVSAMCSRPTSMISTQRILDSFTDRPACLYNARFDVLAANAAARAVYGADMASGTEWTRNMIWRSFMDTDRRRIYPDVTTDLGIRNLIQVLRMNSAKREDHGQAESLVDEMRHVSEEFNRIWLERKVATLSSVPGRISPRGRGDPINVQYSRLHIPDSAGQVIAAIIPTDVNSAMTLDRYLNSAL